MDAGVALDVVEVGGEPARRLAFEPRLGLLEHVGRVVVEGQLDRGLRGRGGVGLVKEAHELARPMASLDAGRRLAGQQAGAGQQAPRAVALAFVVTRYGRVRSGPRWQAGCGGRSGAVAPLAWRPGFSSPDTTATFVPAAWTARRRAASRQARGARAHRPSPLARRRR